MYSYPHKLLKLINEISKLPGVGPKMAERIGLFLLRRANTELSELTAAIDGISGIGFCTVCHNVSEKSICSVCADDARDKTIICAVESPEDVITVEKTGKFNGTYHVIHGLINPLAGIMPDKLKIKELADRLKKNPATTELILAFNHTVEGDATALYVHNAVKEQGLNIRITRPARGLPTGSDIKYADEITLGQAFLERKEMK